MLMLVALGVMSVTWMVVIAVIVLAQKLLPPIRSSTCCWRWRSPDSGSGSS